MISVPTLISLTFLAAAGVGAWIRIEVKTAKLEARMDAKDEHLERIERKLDSLLAQ